MVEVWAVGKLREEGDKEERERGWRWAGGGTVHSSCTLFHAHTITSAVFRLTTRTRNMTTVTTALLLESHGYAAHPKYFHPCQSSISVNACWADSPIRPGQRKVGWKSNDRGLPSIEQAWCRLL